MSTAPQHHRSINTTKVIRRHPDIPVQRRRTPQELAVERSMRSSVKEQEALGFSMKVYLQGKTMRAFSNIQVCHIFWEETCVAHKLAHTADFFWLWMSFGLRREIPSIMEDVIFEDFCKSIRCALLDVQSLLFLMNFFF